MSDHRDADIIEAAQAVCNMRHPSFTRSGTRYCCQCLKVAQNVVLKLEDLGWMDRERISDYVSDAMDEG